MTRHYVFFLLGGKLFSYSLWLVCVLGLAKPPGLIVI
jgi:hypothetical protein